MRVSSREKLCTILQLVNPAGAPMPALQSFLSVGFLFMARRILVESENARKTPGWTGRQRKDLSLPARGTSRIKAISRGAGAALYRSQTGDLPIRAAIARSGVRSRGACGLYASFDCFV